MQEHTESRTERAVMMVEMMVVVHLDGEYGVGANGAWNEMEWVYVAE